MTAGTRTFRSPPKLYETTEVVKYLTVSQVARKLGVCEATVCRYVRGMSGFPQPTGRNLDRGRLFPEWAVDQWIDGRRIRGERVSA